MSSLVSPLPLINMLNNILKQNSGQIFFFTYVYRCFCTFNNLLVLQCIVFLRARYPAFFSEEPSVPLILWQDHWVICPLSLQPMVLYNPPCSSLYGQRRYNQVVVHCSGWTQESQTPGWVQILGYVVSRSVPPSATSHLY